MVGLLKCILEGRSRVWCRFTWLGEGETLECYFAARFAEI